MSTVEVSIQSEPDWEALHEALGPSIFNHPESYPGMLAVTMHGVDEEELEIAARAAVLGAVSPRLQTDRDLDLDSVSKRDLLEALLDDAKRDALRARFA
jgi:hypothetical protein